MCPKHDVEWRVPKRKRPIAYSTEAISDFIVDLAEKGGTIFEIYQQSLNTYCYDAQEILKKYIDLGHGDIKASRYFHRTRYIYLGENAKGQGKWRRVS